MPKKIDSLLIYNIAKYYYKDGLEQDAIANMVGISRSQVSRLLTKARSMGIVQFKLVYPVDTEYEDLAEEMKRYLGIDEVKIVPVDEEVVKKNEAHIGQAIAIYAAKYLPDLIMDAKVVGTGWGNTVYQSILHMDHYAGSSDLLFVPLVGSVGQYAPCYQINSIIDRISEKFKSKGMFINSPAYLDKERYGRLNEYKEKMLPVMELWNKVDLAIIGLGKPLDKSDYLENEMDPVLLRRLRHADIAGDILGQFFHTDGSIHHIGEHYHLLGFDVAKLKYVENVVCLCGGKDKADGIVIAAQAGYFKTLITDSSTAQLILERR